ncbi:endothelin-converting enzyme 1 [Plakobranchus ocellatus]|uniref:Endothelin-converting enzyme 1 n=1 Tax=Plakobranchus ocellatus TaxID=259542 RepID=A0AAV4ALK4_9GAST|nr:endothelin-converting enzyme 1 [Plakobranchus ocellatus]
MSGKSDRRNRFCALDCWLVFLAVLHLCGKTDGLTDGVYKKGDTYFGKRSDDTCGQCCDGICTDIECVNEAVRLESFMNMSADPCTDFDEYACGGFYKNQNFKDGRTIVDYESIIREQVNKILISIVEEEERHNIPEPFYVGNMKRFYKSCMDTDQIEKDGLGFYLNSTEAMEWPTLIGQDWCEENFDLNDLITKYAGLLFNPLFDIDILSIYGSPMSYVAVTEIPKQGMAEDWLVSALGEVDLGLKSRFKLYENYLRDIAVELGADPVVAADDAEAVATLIVKIHEIRSSHWRYRHRAEFAFLNLSQVTEDMGHDFLDFQRIISAYATAANFTSLLSNKIMIRNAEPAYFEGLKMILQKTDCRTIRNFFGFEYAKTKVMITKRMRAIHLKYLKAFGERTEEEARSETCISETRRFYNLALLSPFLERAFKNAEAAKTDVKNLWTETKYSLDAIIYNITWMSNTSKLQLSHVVPEEYSHIMYDRWATFQGDLGTLYQDDHSSNGSYYNNREELTKLRTKKQAFWLTRYPFIHRPGSFVTTGVDYAADYNGWLVPSYLTAAYAQEPRYSFDYTSAHNYGSLGGDIAYLHLLAADDIAMNPMIWSEEEHPNYDRYIFCFKHQYEHFLDDKHDSLAVSIAKKRWTEASRRMDLAHTIADSAALRLAYATWKNHVLHSGTGEDLPGIDLRQEKLFFVAYAQRFCEKKTPERSELDQLRLKTSGRYRILSSMWNSEEFAAAFNCPSGSRMNHPTKCSMWT